MAFCDRLGSSRLQYRLAQAELLVYQQNFAEALKLYEEILSFDYVKETERKHVLLKYVEAGVLALIAGVKSVDIDRLLAHAKKRVEMRDAEDWEAYYWLGMVYKYLGKREDAIKVLELALNVKGAKDFVRMARDELLLPETDREPMLPSFCESLNTGNMITGMNLTPEKAMNLAKMVEGTDDPNLMGLEDLIKGHMYRDGYNVVKDLRKAFPYYKKAADQGNPEAMYEVALMYLRGKGVEKNFKKAFEMLHMVTEAPGLGDRASGPAASANYTLGWLHLNGVGTPADADIAYSFFTKSSASGHASAAFMLGNMYSSGLGPVALDMEKAVQYWELAATRGTPEGMVPLACHYLYKGEFEIADKWFAKAKSSKFVTADMEQKYSRLYQQTKMAHALSNLPKEKNERVTIGADAIPSGSTSKNAGDLDAFLANVVRSCLLGRSDPFEEVLKKQGDVSGKKSDNLPTSTNKKMSRLSDPFRTEIIEKQRDGFTQTNSVSLPGHISYQVPFTIARPALTQIAPKHFKACRFISLREMAMEEDKVFTDRYTIVTVIDEPFSLVALQLVVEDDQGTPQRLSIYGFDRLVQRPVYGTRMELYNPYHRRAVDSLPTLRIDDPSSVVVKSTDPSLCRYCSAPGALFSCGRCKKSKYCNKHCQAKDWKILKHSSVCKVITAKSN